MCRVASWSRQISVRPLSDAWKHDLPKRAEARGQLGVVRSVEDVAFELTALRILLGVVGSQILALPFQAHDSCLLDWTEPKASQR
jgi:hypothetical protein